MPLIRLIVCIPGIIPLVTLGRQSLRYVRRGYFSLLMTFIFRLRQIPPPRPPFSVWHIADVRNKKRNTPHATLHLTNSRFILVPDQLKTFDLYYALLFCFYWLLYFTPPWITINPQEQEAAQQSAALWSAAFDQMCSLFARKTAAHFAHAWEHPELLWQFNHLWSVTIDTLYGLGLIVKTTFFLASSQAAATYQNLKPHLPMFTSYHWENDFLDTLATHWAMLSIALIWIVLPALLHAFAFHTDVLRRFGGHVPAAHRDQIQNAFEHTIYTTHHGASTLRFIYNNFIMFLHNAWDQLKTFRLATTKNPIYWQDSSMVTSIVIACTGEYIGSTDEHENSWTGYVLFIRFCAVYCRPIFTSYLWLLLTLALFRTPGPSRMYLCFGWGIIALYFIHAAIHRYASRSSSLKDHLPAIRYAPLWNVIYPPKDNWVTRSSWINRLTSFIFSIAMVLAIMAVQILPTAPDSSYTPYRHIYNSDGQK